MSRNCIGFKSVWDFMKHGGFFKAWAASAGPQGRTRGGHTQTRKSFKICLYEGLWRFLGIVSPELMGFDYGIFVGLASSMPMSRHGLLHHLLVACSFMRDYKSLYRSSMGLVPLLGGFRRVRRELNALPCLFLGRLCNGFTSRIPPHSFEAALIGRQN